MRLRNIQFDPNIQMYALHAAAKAEAKRKAELTRKKLRSFASALAGELSDGADCEVKLGGDGAPQGQAKRQNEGADSESDGNPTSYWA